MDAILALAIAILASLTGSDTSLSCFDAKVKMGSDFADVPIYFVVSGVEWLAQADDNEAPYIYSVSFPEDGDKLVGTQTLQGVRVLGEYHAIANPLTVDCGGQRHTIFLPIVYR